MGVAWTVGISGVNMNILGEILLKLWPFLWNLTSDLFFQVKVAKIWTVQDASKVRIWTS